MDHYTKEAYEKVRKRIVGHIDKLEAVGKTGSGDLFNIKNWRRFGAAFAWDPEVYLDILENPDMPDKELMSKLRNKESALMKKWGVIEKYPLHHIIASRTGGDLGIRTPADEWLEVRERLFQKFGLNPGNGPANLNASGQINELAHLNRIGAKGSVFELAGAPQEVIDELMPKYLHRKGQDLGEGKKIWSEMLRKSPVEKASFLESKITQQLERYADAQSLTRLKWERDLMDSGINLFLEKTDPNGFPLTGFSPESRIENQPLLKALGEAVQITDDAGRQSSLAQTAADGFVGKKPPTPITANNAILPLDTKEAKKFQKLLRTNGAMRLRVAGMIPFLGAPIGAVSKDTIQESRDEEIQENPNDPTLKANKFLDNVSGTGDQITTAGYAALGSVPQATSIEMGLGLATVGAGMVIGGEVLSTGTSIPSIVIDGGRASYRHYTTPQTTQQKVDKLNTINLNR